MSRKRSSCDLLDVVSLCSDLEPLARLKDPPFDWECARYGKRRRSQGPDRDGLKFYLVLLTIFVLHAPAGFPPLARVREAWLWLDKHHSIMAADLVKLQKDRFEWASQCGDSMRLMMKYLVAPRL